MKRGALKRIACIGLAVLLCMALTAAAQDAPGQGQQETYEWSDDPGQQGATGQSRMQQGQDRPRQQGWVRQPMQQGMQRQRMVQAAGTIVELRQVKIYGQEELHVVAAISTPQGRTRVVDLGARSQLDQLQIRQGDRIQVRGVRGSINNNPVLVARQVRAGGGQLSINRTWNRRDFRLKGQIVGVRTVTLPGDDNPHLLATIRTEQGRQVMVDLGRRSILRQQNVTFTRGQPLTLIVQPTRAGSRQILRARRISTREQMMQRTI